MIFEEFNHFIVPIVVYLAETLGLIIVVYHLARCFIEFLLNGFGNRHYDIGLDMSTGLAVALSFLLSAEVLKTIIVTEQGDIVLLCLTVGIHVALTLLVHFELGHKGSENYHNPNALLQEFDHMAAPVQEGEEESPATHHPKSTEH